LPSQPSHSAYSRLSLTAVVFGSFLVLSRAATRIQSLVVRLRRSIGPKDPRHMSPVAKGRLAVCVAYCRSAKTAEIGEQVTDLRGYHLARDDGSAIWMLDTLMHVKAATDDTRGAFTLIEALAPSGFGTPLHIHHREEEGFYVLDGSITVQCGDDRWEAVPGSFVLLPRGVPHAYLVNEGPCRMLQVTSPAQFERFAEEVGRPAESATLPQPSAPDFEKIEAVGARLGIETVGPALQR
jgi:quercetin dioxygenase-like cupin family protein